MPKICIRCKLLRLSQLINVSRLLSLSLLPLSWLHLLYSITVHKFRHQKIICNNAKTIRGLNSIRSNVNGVESSRLYGRTPAYRSPILVTVYEIRAEITFIVLCPLRATSLAGWMADWTAFSLLGENFPPVRRGPFVLLPVTRPISAHGRTIGDNKRRGVGDPNGGDSSFTLGIENLAEPCVFPYVLQCDRF